MTQFVTSPRDVPRGTPYHRDFEGGQVPDRYRLVADRVGRGKRVLEVGCHTGYFSRVLRQDDCAVWGMELNPEAAEQARPFLEGIVIGNADDRSAWDRVGGGYDVVLFMDVLEHLYDPWSVLGYCRGHLADGGRVLATLPNVACWNVRRELLKGRFVPDCTGLNDWTHIRWFTLWTALELFRETGYEVLGYEAAWTCVPLAHRVERLPWLGRRWRDWWVRRHPNLAISVPLIEARARVSG
jgi:SAM-dependent methyltransferase